MGLFKRVKEKVESTYNPSLHDLSAPTAAYLLELCWMIEEELGIIREEKQEIDNQQLYRFQKIVTLSERQCTCSLSEKCLRCIAHDLVTEVNRLSEVG